MADRRERTGTDLSPVSGSEQLSVGLASDPRRSATGSDASHANAAGWSGLRKETRLLVQPPNATARCGSLSPPPAERAADRTVGCSVDHRWEG